MLNNRFEGLNLAADFCKAWNDASGTPADLNGLREDPALLTEIIHIARGSSNNFRYHIDCDADPRSGQYALMQKHNRQGKVIWNPDCIQLLHAEQELGCQRLESIFRIKNWKHKSAANACMLDFFLRRPGVLDPEVFVRSHQFKPVRYIFAGTTYKVPPGGGYAGFVAYRCLQHNNYGWAGEMVNVEHGVQPSDVLVVLKRE